MVICYLDTDKKIWCIIFVIVTEGKGMVPLKWVNLYWSLVHSSLSLCKQSY